MSRVSNDALAQAFTHLPKEEWTNDARRHFGQGWDASRTHYAAQEPTRVAPAWIEEKRAQGWPDMHPEDYCHRCGNRNPAWYVSSREQWLAGTEAWAEETGREGICCPSCFAEMWEEQHGPGWSLDVRMAHPGETAQEPTDAEVEAAAQAIDPAPWRSGHPASLARREDIRSIARAALTAARVAGRDAR